MKTKQHRVDWIRSLPTTSDAVVDEDGMHVDGELSETVFRSYAILNYVKDLLKLDTEPCVILELITLMETPFPKDRDE